MLNYKTEQTFTINADGPVVTSSVLVISTSTRTELSLYICWQEHILIPKLKNNSKLVQQLADYKSHPAAGNGTVSKSFIEDNLIKVEIYFGSMTTTCINQVPIVGDAEFVAEMGKLWSSYTSCRVFLFFSNDLKIK